MATELLLTRHAEAAHVARPDIVAGRATTSLITSEGFSQSRRLGLVLPDFGPTLAHVSPAKRARQTSEEALDAAELPLVPVEFAELHEQCLGENEGRPRELVYTDAVRARLDELGADFQHPGFNEAGEAGESLTQVTERMLGYVARTRAEAELIDQRIFATSHHIAIKGLVARIHLGGLHAVPNPVELNQAVREMEPILPCARTLLVVEGDPNALRCRIEYVGEPLPSEAA